MSNDEKREIILKALETELWWAETFAKTAIPYGRQDITSKEYARAQKIRDVISEYSV